jgi:hypothetical protein
MTRFEGWEWETPRRPFAPVTWVSIIFGMGLVIGGMWIWGQAGNWAWGHGAARPEIMAMAIRAGGVAAIALGQWLWIGPAGERLCRPDALGRWLSRLSVAVALGAMVAAAALAWAGR